MQLDDRKFSFGSLKSESDLLSAPLHLAIYIMQQLITSKQIIFKFIICNMFKFSGTLLFDSFRFLVHSFVFFYRSLN